MKAFRARLFSESRSRETAAYHPSDRRRIMDSDEYCWRFIVHNRLDLERAVRMADAALKWRAQARLHELTESSLPSACLQAGFVHPFNVDRYGNHVLLLRPANIRNLPLTDVRRVLVFFVETLLRRQNASRITLLVDCVGGDRHQVKSCPRIRKQSANTESVNDQPFLLYQLDLGRYLMALFRCYYPRSLGFVLLWQPPRLLQGIWKLCKGLMPVEALERIRFVTVRDIGRYVDRDKLPVRMGGTDNYQYAYVPGKPLGERCPRLAPLDPVSCPTASLHVYGMFTA
ncbi:motile sperm domain-containing protein 2-like [Dermacentor variabilis]|uniref:motile sperm domain-containing protein 2-like n=1 Tax=Dermacentor variabilis TaxID=34621 RepID=UPI003F5B0900